jgi:hypothetical protein
VSIFYSYLLLPFSLISTVKQNNNKNCNQHPHLQQVKPSFIYLFIESGSDPHVSFQINGLLITLIHLLLLGFSKLFCSLIIIQIIIQQYQQCGSPTECCPQGTPSQPPSCPASSCQCNGGGSRAGFLNTKNPINQSCNDHDYILLRLKTVFLFYIAYSPDVEAIWWRYLLSLTIRTWIL